jgi:sterol desaturase/sphingolipid hydroxylase (fatty acid hydroxylase superfamily)
MNVAIIDPIPSNLQTDDGVTAILTVVLIVAFFIFVAVELIKPYRRFGAELAKASFTTNTTAFLFNNIVLTLFSASSLFLVAQQYSFVGLLSGFEPSLMKAIASFLFYDLAIYAWHVANHHFEFLWRFHKIHHSDKSFNVTTGLRFHVADMFIELLFKALVVILIGIDAYTILVCELIKTIFVLFHHCNIAFKGEMLLSQVIIVPWLHRLHHSTLRSEHDSNYGITLAIWDRMFDTRQEAVPKKIGLELVEADNFVQLFFLAFVTERQIAKILQFFPKGRR